MQLDFNDFNEFCTAAILEASPATSASLNRSFRDIIPALKSVRSSRSRRAVAHAKIITASPYKRKLKEAELEKHQKMDVKKKRLDKAYQQSSTHVSPKVKKPRSQKPLLENKKGKKSGTSATRKSGKGEIDGKKRASAFTGKSKITDASCLYCCELYSESTPREVDTVSGSCSKWAHNSCAGLTKSQKCFVCEIYQH